MNPKHPYLFPDPNRPYGKRRSVLQNDDGQMDARWNGEGMDFNMVFELPRDVSGDRCIIQWRYYTANSCEMPGYRDYAWPGADWRNPAGGWGLSTCQVPLSNATNQGGGGPVVTSPAHNVAAASRLEPKVEVNDYVTGVVVGLGLLTTC